jgi:RecA/RadA recombinase
MSDKKDKKFDIGDYRSKLKVSQAPLKDNKYIALEPCLQEIMGLPGIPLGHITQVYGKSDTGKTSLLFHAAAQAQKQGILPVLVITEHKVDWDRAEQMGFDPSGAIIEENLEFLEDVFGFMDKIITDVTTEALPHDVCIFWDSVGNTISKDEVKINKDGTTEVGNPMMKAARVISSHMRVLSTKVGNTRKESCKYFVGTCFINRAYTKPPEFYGGRSTLVPYGGDAIWYNASLVLKTQRRQKLVAQKEGKEIGFGIVSKIGVEKNHISNTTNSGDFVITSDKIFPNDRTQIASYKEEKRDTWGNMTLYARDDGEVVDE